MRKTISGERTATFGVLLGLLAVMAIAVAMILFVLDTRNTAKESQKVAKAAVASESSLRAIIQGRCEQRIAYDQRFVKAAEGDEQFYDDLLRLSKEAAAVRTIALTPAQQAIVNKQMKMIQSARDRKALIIKEGVIGNCNVFQRRPTPSPHV